MTPNRPMHYPGFIAPNGKLYSCPYGQHRYLARELLAVDNPLLELEEQGWLHINHLGFVNLYRVETITQAQMTTLGDLLICEHHTTPPPNIAKWGAGDIYTNGTAEGWKRNLRQCIKYFEDKVKN